MRERYFVILISLLLMTGMILAACKSDADVSLDGISVLEDRCVECHNLSRVKTASKSREEWSRTIDRMITHGAELTSEETDVLLDYLEATYP